VTHEVEVSSEAATSLQSLPPAVRRSVVRAIDRLVDAGLPEEALPTDAETRAWRIRAGGYEVLIADLPGRRGFLVVRIEAVTEFGARPVVRSLPLPSRVADLITDVGSDLVSDLRYTFRSFRRSWGFVAAVVLTLGMGLGGSTALVAVTNTVFRGALPFEDGERLLRLRNFTLSSDGAVRAFNMNPRDFLAIREGSRHLSGVAAAEGGSLSLLGDGPADRVNVIGVSPGWARVMGITPYLGRWFTAEEEAIGTEAGVAILSHGLWRDRFGGESTILGTEIAYDGGTLVVVGVMPPRFGYPYDAELWRPWTYDPADWRSHDLHVVGRMVDGASISVVDA
jgi:mRNA-degrading endonuclease RelE of RelBE toxin-antitoxin system